MWERVHLSVLVSVCLYFVWRYKSMSLNLGVCMMAKELVCLLFCECVVDVCV